MDELANNDKEKTCEAEESQQEEPKHSTSTQLEQNIRAEQTQTQENLRTVSQLVADDQESQLSSETLQNQDLQTLLKQLSSERSELLTRVEHLYLTGNRQGADNAVTCGSCHSCSMHSLEKAERMKSALKCQRSHSTHRQSPVKGGTYDSELMRAIRERDEMRSVLEKYERHMSEIQANIRVLTAERDKTTILYQQAQVQIADLRHEMLTSKGSKHSAAQNILKRLEAERDEALSDLHHMSTERDSLHERLKISQGIVISERAHLEQKVEDLQNALLTVEQKRAEEKSRQVEMKEAMMGLEEEVKTLRRKLTATDGELSCMKNECSVLRISKNQTDNTLNETQKRLINRIGDLQHMQTQNKQLNERNDILLKEVTVLKEEVTVLQNTVSELNQHRDTLQEQLEKKNDLLRSNNKELDDKENSIHSMTQKIEDLEATLDVVKETVSSRDQALDMMRKKLLDSGDELNNVLKHTEATLEDNTQLRDELDQVHLDNKALQIKVNNAAREIDVLERKMQNYVSDMSSIEDLLSSKERECRELQECRVELRTSDSEKHRLKERVDSLENSLKKALNAERSCSAELKQLKSTLEKQEEDLQQVQSKHLHTQQDLEKARDLCVKLDTSKETVQRELELCRSELELLRKQLAIEREKELHRQLSSQERLVEIQLLRDKLAVADSMMSTQSREVAQVRTREALLEADLEATRRQLNTERDERERAAKELRRLGLSSPFGSPILSSTLCAPPSPVRQPFSPHTTLHHVSPDHLSKSRSLDRSFRDLED